MLNFKTIITFQTCDYKSTTTTVISSWIFLFLPAGIYLIFSTVNLESRAAFSNALYINKDGICFMGLLLNSYATCCL